MAKLWNSIRNSIIGAVVAAVLALIVLVFNYFQDTRDLLDRAEKAGGLPGMIAALIQAPAFQLILIAAALVLAARSAVLANRVRGKMPAPADTARLAWHPARNGLVIRGVNLGSDTLQRVVVTLDRLEWSGGNGQYIPAEEIPEGKLPLRLTGGSSQWRSGAPIDYPFIVNDKEIAVIQLHPSTKGGVEQFRITRSGQWLVHLRLKGDGTLQTNALRFSWDGSGGLLPLDA